MERLEYGYQLFSVVYFSRGTLLTKKEMGERKSTNCWGTTRLRDSLCPAKDTQKASRLLPIPGELRLLLAAGRQLAKPRPRSDHSSEDFRTSGLAKKRSNRLAYHSNGLPKKGFKNWEN